MNTWKGSGEGGGGEERAPIDGAPKGGVSVYMPMSTRRNVMNNDNTIQMTISLDIMS